MLKWYLQDLDGSHTKQKGWLVLQSYRWAVMFTIGGVIFHQIKKVSRSRFVVFIFCTIIITISFWHSLHLDIRHKLNVSKMLRWYPGCLVMYVQFTSFIQGFIYITDIKYAHYMYSIFVTWVVICDRVTAFVEEGCPKMEQLFSIW